MRTDPIPSSFHAHPLIPELNAIQAPTDQPLALASRHHSPPQNEQTTDQTDTGSDGPLPFVSNNPAHGTEDGDDYENQSHLGSIAEVHSIIIAPPSCTT
jgi:hypothetical protein